MLTLLLIVILIALSNAVEITYLNSINYSNSSQIWITAKMSTNIPIHTYNITDEVNSSYDDEDRYDWIMYTI
jgi:hypothetical protein